jgi:hypothetical protein
VLLGEANEQPDRLLSAADKRREIRSFEVALTRAMGSKAGRGAGTFIGDTRAQLFAFYGDVVQDLVGWQRKAPRLPDVEVLDEPPVIEPSAQPGEPEIATPELAPVEGFASTPSPAEEEPEQPPSRDW